jgi:death-on-curing protein
LKFPTLEDIVKHNRQHLKAVGHLKERGSLEWVLDAIQHPIFGVDRYPTLVEKAAKLTWTIIHGHVFWDGNKRTGMSVLYAFLRWNGYRLNATDEETVEIALRVAGARTEGDYTYEEFVQWVRDRIVIDKE